MEVIVRGNGLHKSETKAVSRMEQELRNSWFSYASVLVADPRGSMEFDMIIVTHDRVLVVELKEWRGKLTSYDGCWYIDGVYRSKSPYHTKRDQALRLSGILSQELSHKLGYGPYVEAHVVMCGAATPEHLSVSERQYVHTLDEFVKITEQADYDRITQTFKPMIYNDRRPRPNSPAAKKIFDQFFRGSRVTPADFQYMDYTAESAPDRVHAGHLFQEYPATHNQQPANKALMRRWDLTMLGLAYHDDHSWRKVVTREEFLFRTASAANSPLEQFMLRPIAPLVEENINSDCVEIFELKRNTRRLEDHINLHGHKWTVEQRLDLVQAMLAPFAELHVMGMAHRDIDTQNLWYSQDHHIVLTSGFHSAFIPEKGSVKDLSDKLRSSATSLPEDVYGVGGEVQSPFARDVFLLALVAHRILYPDARITLEDNIPVWRAVENDPLNGKMNSFFEKAMELEQKSRFANASDMLAEFNTITIGKPLQYDDTSEVIGDIAEGDFIKKDWASFALMSYFPPAPGIAPPVSGEKITYQCLFEGERALIKFWPKANVDVKSPGVNRRILRMRKRIEQTLDADFPLAKLLTYGLFAGGSGLFVVTRFEQGQLWSEHVQLLESKQARIEAALSLCNLISTLHSNHFAHGDLHPANILVQSVEPEVSDDPASASAHFRPILIDVFDYGDTSDPYNVEYGPPNPTSTDNYGRDLFATYQIVDEMLRAEALDAVAQEIVLARQQPNSIPVSIEPLQKVLRAALNALRAPEPLKIEPLRFMATDFKLPDKELLLQPIGATYYFHAERSERNRAQFLCRISAQDKRLNFIFDPQKRSILTMWVSDLSFSDYIQSGQRAQLTFTTPVIVVKGIAPEKSPDPIAEFIFSIDAVLDLLLSEKESDEVEDPSITLSAVDQAIRPTEIWKALLKTEVEQRVRVQVRPGTLDESPSGALLIPCQLDNEASMEFSEEDTDIGIYLAGDSRAFGVVITEESSMDTLAVRVFSEGSRTLKHKLTEGVDLFFESKRNSVSRSRRQDAMDRVLRGGTRIASLAEYFDGAGKVSSAVTGVAPDEGALRNRYDNESEQLNPGQITAFQRVISEGPIGVLQGPPGTGKTAFVSKLIHYLFENKLARNILLVGQSHTSVDTVAIKAREVCTQKGTEVSVIRLGREALIDDKLLQCHSSSIQRQIRHKFQREYEKRINALSSRLMLSQSLVEELAKLHRSVGPLLDRVQKLMQQQADIDSMKHLGSEDIEESSSELKTKLVDCLDILERNLRTRGYDFELPGAHDPDFWNDLSTQVARQHGVTNQLALQRLNNLIGISKDWIDVLGSGGANYDKFLIKTSQLVCGTLVGIGARGLNIEELEFDWVIVDEAGRAQASELMIAMQCAHRVLLVGDHKQLAPSYDRAHIRSVGRLLEIDENEVRKTDFERAFNVNKGIALDTQYRMIEPIGEIISHCFYDDALQSHRKQADDWYANLPYPMNIPVTWIDSGSGERAVMEEEIQKGKFINRHELAVCIELLKKMAKPEHLAHLKAKQTESHPHPIGIITMYQAQKRLLEEELSRAEWASQIRPMIQVGTVDSYQGKENEVVILSLVRNNPSARQGFLGDASRINVSLSRAKQRLVIIGAERMWQSSSHLSALTDVLNYITEQQVIRPDSYERVDGTTVIKDSKHA